MSPIKSFSQSPPPRVKGGSPVAGRISTFIQMNAERLRSLESARKEVGHLARCLRQESTLSLKSIAQRLKMGAWTHVSNLLVQHRQQGKKRAGV